MSSNGKRVRRPEPYVCGKATPPQPGDEQIGAYSYEQRMRMDEKFTRAVERAFETGAENRQAAVATLGRLRYD
jgi:hypothetical protein